ncbi:MAG: sensor domain-containing diguanylate cyclase, partial [Erysipelotrichia bacterium]|nr:sensor domain-containing diguanylate cyclase [Erysipelotrichia bacterium]
TINSIEILDNEFESLINNKATFINYDEVVEKISLKYELLKKLNSQEFYENYDLELKNLVDDLNYKWKEKHQYLERFKSNNSAIIGSFNYIMELIKNIKLTQNIDIKDGVLLDNSLSLLFKLFVNIDFDKQILEENITNLQKLSLKYNNSDFSFLFKKYNSTINELLNLNNIKFQLLEIDVKSKLNLIESKLHKEYNKSIDKQLNIAILLFFISIIFLVISILNYIKSVKIKKELKAFKYAVENSDNSIVMTDVNRKITYVNESFEKVTGYKREDVLGKNPHILKSGKLPSDFYKNMNNILDKGEKWSGEFININKFGDIYYETASITPIFNEYELTGYLAIKLNVTDYVKQQEKVEFIAHHDNLTLLPNRRSLEKKVNEYIHECLAQQKKFALYFIDLDGFKNVNDTLGHDIGDLLLKEVAKIFKDSLREEDLVFRIGGDEFAIIIKYSNDEKDLKVIANKIIENINNPIFIKNHKINVGCSIGISVFPKDAQDLKNLLKYSDTAMYKAKQNGKNRVEFYDK